MDQDINYSEPANVRATVHPDYRRIALQAGLALSLVGLAVVGVRSRRRRRERDQARESLMQELEEELQTAHDMQMSLVPTGSPQITGIDVAGQCLPANHVGGDTFQYFPQDGSLSIAVGDVTGHDMEAAIFVVMFSGVLDKVMEFPMDLPERFSSLNRSLCRKRTYVCFSMAEISPEAHTLRLASCGNPYPLHFHAGEVSQLKVQGYPLGVRPDTTYNAIEADLDQGDYLAFVSDGIPEAVNGNEEMLGDERIQATIRQGCIEGLSAEALIDRLLAEVGSFCAEVAQEDDMTCVALLCRYDRRSWDGVTVP